MKSLPLAAVILLLPAALFAGIDAQFASDVDKAAQKLHNSRLTRAVVDDFVQRLSQLAHDAGCRNSPQLSGTTNCAGAGAAAIQRGETALARFNSDLDAAIATDARKSLASLLHNALEDVNNKLKTANLAAGDRTSLQRRYDDFVHSLSIPTGQPSEAAARQTLQQISDDIDAAAALDKNGKTVLGDLTKAYNTLHLKIQNSILQTGFKGELYSQLDALISPDCLLRALKANAAVPHGCVVDPTTTQSAIGQIAQLSATVDKDVTTYGKKSPPEYYRALAEALRKQVTASRLQASDKTALDRRIENFESTLTGLVGGSSHVSPVERIDSAYQSLLAEVNAALSLSGDKETLFKTLSDAYAKLNKQVSASKLDKSIQRDFTSRAQSIVQNAGCQVQGALSCRAADPVKIQQAVQELTNLGNAVAQAVATYGTKTLAQYYGPLLEALRKRVTSSKIGADDKNALERRIQDFFGPSLGAQGPGRSCHSFSALADRYAALSADVDAAIQLAGTK